jgi:hypothetical protein
VKCDVNNKCYCSTEGFVPPPVTEMLVQLFPASNSTFEFSEGTLNF